MEKITERIDDFILNKALGKTKYDLEIEEAERRRVLMCHYLSKEDRIKAIGAERLIDLGQNGELLPNELKTKQMIGVPSWASYVTIYHYRYWLLLKPILDDKSVKYKILDQLPRDVGLGRVIRNRL